LDRAIEVLLGLLHFGAEFADPFADAICVARDLRPEPADLVAEQDAECAADNDGEKDDGRDRDRAGESESGARNADPTELADERIQDVGQKDGEDDRDEDDAGDVEKGHDGPGGDDQECATGELLRPLAVCALVVRFVGTPGIRSVFLGVRHQYPCRMYRRGPRYTWTSERSVKRSLRRRRGGRAFRV
jgi:hypothetical protein